MAEILIRNMEMPKDGCETCPFNKKVPDIYQRIGGKRKIIHWTNSCVIDGRWRDVFSDSVPECPLVELPSHGRLIDADEMARQFNYYADICRKRKASVLEEAWETSARHINEADTVIPASGETTA